MSEQLNKVPGLGDGCGRLFSFWRRPSSEPMVTRTAKVLETPPLAKLIIEKKPKPIIFYRQRKNAFKADPIPNKSTRKK